MEKKKLENEIKKQKSLDEKEDLSREINKYGGLWVNDENMADNLRHFESVKLKIEAIKCQIRYRKTVLCQKFSDKKLLQVGGSDKSGKYKPYNICMPI